MNISRYDSNEMMSRVVEYNGVVYVAGLTADDRSLGMKAQTEQVLAKIDGYLAKAGTDKSKLLTAMIYITDMSQKPAMNEAWNAWIDPDNKSTRACVCVELDGPQTLVEIVVNAAR